MAVWATAALFLTLTAAQAAGAAPSWPIAMAARPPVSKDVAAFPRIAGPTDAARRRINAALAKFDAAMPATLRECRTGSPGPAASAAYWSRKIRVAMAGPRFLSLIVSDDAFCGGAHPNTEVRGLVYDLETGRQADWTRLLAPSLAGKITQREGMDGVRTARLASARLHALYLAGYGATAQGGNADCRDAVTRAPDSPPEASVWLDGAKGGLAVVVDVAHFAEGCALPVVVPTARLRAAGASRDLTDALSAAHKLSAGNRRPL